MDTIGKRFRHARLTAQERLNLSRKVTQSAVAEAAGCTRPTITQCETGVTNNMMQTNMLKAAEFLQVNYEWLAFGVGSMEPSPHPKNLNELPLASIQELIDSAKFSGSQYITIDRQMAQWIGGSAFAIQVEGDSMIPEFREGDTVLVDPDQPVSPGDIVIARLSSNILGKTEITLRKYRARGTDDNGAEIFELAPLNNDYPTLLINQNNPATIVGAVVEHRRKFRFPKTSVV
ncbi:MAG: LexA family protein [Endozoicomonas sp.]